MIHGESLTFGRKVNADMNNCIFFNRVLKATLPLAAIAGCFLASLANAQEEKSKATAPKILRTTKRDIYLPIELDPKVAANIRDIFLYMRQGNGPWECLERCSPTAKQFIHQLPGVGEFGLSLVTIDSNGNSTPKDVAHLEPEIIVVVEAPKKSEPTGPPPLATAPGQKPGTDLHQGTQKIVQPVQGTATFVELPQAAADPKKVEPPILAPPAAAKSQASNTLVLPRPMGRPAVVQPEPVANKVEVAKASENMALPAFPPLPPNNIGNSPPTAPVQQVKYTPEPQAPVKTPLHSVKYLNSTKVGIDFNINKAGPSGLSKIEAWLTYDMGNTWQRWSMVDDHGNHAEIDLPGEGVYGIRLVATNGHGFGGREPQSGEQPTATFEVDLTPPVIQHVDVNPVGKNGAVEIRWKAADKNLAGEPVTLFYATQRGGPWEAMAAPTKNTGFYNWPLPKNVAPQYFIRLEVRDLAGNVTRCDAPTPVVLDLQEPEISLVDLTPIPVSPSGQR